MEGNIIDSCGDSISNTSLNSDMYDVMNNATSRFFDSDLYDSTELEDIRLSKQKARDRMSNKQPTKQTATGDFQTKLASKNHTTERNTKHNMPTFQLQNHNVKKLDFSPKNEEESTTNEFNFDANYGVMKCTTLTISESGLNDSTDISKQTSCQANRSNKVPNNQSFKQTNENFCRMKTTCTNPNAEGNPKSDLLTSAPSKRHISKYDFSSNYMVRRYNKSSISDNASADNMNYVSDLRFTDVKQETSTDKSLKNSVLTSKHTDKPKIKFATDYSDSNSKSCVDKSRNRTDMYLSRIKRFYGSQSKQDFKTYQRHRHCIPIFDAIKSRDDGRSERVSVFDVSFTSGWEFEDDLRFERFCGKLFTPKNPNECSINFKEKDESKEENKSFKESDKEKLSDKESVEEKYAPIDKYHRNSTLNASNKLSDSFRLLDFSWISQKSKELKQKLSNSFKTTKKQEVN